MKMPAYDRIATGDRLREKRILLGYTQDEMAEKINRVPKYYADIERGNCGMSIETMLSLSSCLNMSLDYLLLGKEDSSKSMDHSEEAVAILEIVDDLDHIRQQGLLRMLHVYTETCSILRKNENESK
jgi:transcriptional regulator with XRE-family HTH domain